MAVLDRQRQLGVGRRNDAVDPLETYVSRNSGQPKLKEPAIR